MIPKDPVILLSYVNTQLRDFYKSLDALCSGLDIEKEWLVETLANIDYSYDERQNQFI